MARQDETVIPFPVQAERQLVRLATGTMRGLQFELLQLISQALNIPQTKLRLDGPLPPEQIERLILDAVRRHEITEAWEQRVLRIGTGTLQSMERRFGIDQDYIGPRADIDAMAREWASTSVARIRMIRDFHVARMVEHVYTAFKEQWTVQQLADQLYAIGTATAAQAQFWARDQLGTMYGEALRAIGVAVGDDGYTWITMLDERVREHHLIRHGQAFLWAHPPSDGHPGMPYNCRCSARRKPRVPRAALTSDPSTR